MKNKGFAISLISYAFTMLFLFFINYTTSWGFPWFIYPMFTLAFVPAVFLCRKNSRWKLFSVIGFLLISIMLFTTNMVTTPDRWWFIFSVYGLMWWPIAVLLGKRAKTVAFSVIFAALTIAFLIAVHKFETPDVLPWYWYAVLPIIWYPVTMIFKDKLNGIQGGIISISIFTAYYLILNYILFPSLTNAVTIIFVSLWGLTGLVCGKKRWFFALSILGTLLTIAYLAFLNIMHSPNTIWVVYPAFALVWWPMSYYFFKVRGVKKIAN